jgi:hypothetical protein
MYTKTYFEAIDYVAELAPDLSTSGKYFIWADDMAGLLSFIYLRDDNTVMDNLTDAVKELQGWGE